MASFGLVGTLVARPGKRAELAGLLLEAADVLRKARGCRLYLVHEPVDDPDSVVVTEAWDSADDHAASLGMPEVRALIGRALPLLAGPPKPGLRTRVLGGLGA